MKSPINVGSSIFRTVREKGYHYVDKTHFILEILERGDVLLVPRPRRFGKTLNLTMLQAFFDDSQDSRSLFEGLNVVAVPAAMAHLNAYPTVFLSLKDLSGSDWTGFQNKLIHQMAILFGSFDPRMAPTATPAQQALSQAIQLGQASIDSCALSLQLLTQLLAQASGKKVVVLIDEYDSPVHEAYQRGYLPEILGFMRNFLGAALKDNPYLERAVITGILRIAKESIFSGLNNLGVYTLLDPEFATCFGFTDAEVHQILEGQGLLEREGEVRAWYNGYRFGGETIYNPWSILTMAMRPNVALQEYWLNTSGNHLIRDLILAGKVCTLVEVERMLRGQFVRKEIDSNVAIRDIAPEAAWSLLLFSGYLTVDNYDRFSQMADLFIPNYEVRRFFERTVLNWLGSPEKSSTLINHLLSGEMQSFADALVEAIQTILGYHDLAGKQQERIYHVFVVGLLASLNASYEVTSNRESGKGRYDLALIPRQPGQPGYLFEFKQAEPAKLDQAAEAALSQIAERDYAAVLRQRGVSQIFSIGLAFSGKGIALACSVQDSGQPQNSGTQHYLAGDEEDRDLQQLPKPKELKPAGNTAKKDSHKEAQIDKPSLATQVQFLQHQHGLPVASLDLLLSLEQKALEMMLLTLRAEPR